MQSEVRLEPYRSNIFELAESVFLNMLGLEVFPCSEELPEDAGLITGAVYYAGAWQGAILLQCDHRQACEFTARLMGIPQPNRFDDDVRDAIGELVNILGGNLKPILPHGSAISMPSVVEGYPHSLRICGNNPLIRLAFQGEAGVFWITVAGLAD
jgi:chemotaxis protein CheX